MYNRKPNWVTMLPADFYDHGVAVPYILIAPEGVWIGQ